METSAERSKSELVANSVPILFEWLSILITALGAAFVVGYLTKDMGFVDVKRRAAMLPFNLSPPTNTLFQYMTCLLTVLAAGALYGRVVLPRLDRVARRTDLIVATATLLVVWLTPLTSLAVAALVVRILIGAWLASPFGSGFLKQHEAFTRLAAWAPLVGILAFCGFFSLVVPPGVSAAVAAAPPGLLGLVAAPFALFILEEWLPPLGLRWERRVSFVIGMVAIPLATFRIAAPVFDFGLILGPVNDLMRGKDILDSVVSTYGFLFTYAVAATFWIFRVTDLYIGLAVLNALAYSVGYAAIFVFLFVRMRRASLCFASMIAVIGLHYFHMHVPITWLPQSGFLRFGAMLPIFFLLYLVDERPASRALEWLLASCCAIALLWTVEVGGYVAMGLAAALGRDLLFHEHGDRRAFRLAGKIAVALGALLVLFTARIWIRHGHLPIWGDLLHFQRAYSAGLAMGRLRSIERWPVLVLISLTTLFLALRVPRSMRHANAWVFLAVFGLASMVYPLGKAPGIFELARVIVPEVLLVAVAVGLLYDRREELFVGRGDSRLNLSTLASMLLIGISAVGTCFTVAEAAPYVAKARVYEDNKAKPIAHATPSWEAFFPTADTRNRFQLDLAAIRALVPADEALPILSKNDTIYYVFAPRKALYKNSFYAHFFFKSDIDDIVNALLSSRVPYLWVDNSSKFQSYENGVDRHIADDVWARIANHYRLLRHAGLLDVYQRVTVAAK